MALQHLRSGTANKRPLPTAMSDGQLAVNTNLASPGLFFKDSNGDIVKVGPVHIGSVAPNASPASTAATALVANTIYKVLTVGTSDFTAVGAGSNAVGVVFTASGTTTGTGTVSGEQGNEKGEMWLDNTGGAYDLKIYDGTAWRSQAGEFVNATGDTMTGDLLFNNANIVFEGSAADDHETTLTVVNPTADRTITLPNVTGTVVTTGDTGSVTSTMITDGTIVNADVNAGAEIAVSKLANGTARQLLQTDSGGSGVEFTSNVDVPGTLDVTGAATFDIGATAGSDTSTANGVVARNNASSETGATIWAINKHADGYVFVGNDENVNVRSSIANDGKAEFTTKITVDNIGTDATLWLKNTLNAGSGNNAQINFGNTEGTGSIKYLDALNKTMLFYVDGYEIMRLMDNNATAGNTNVEHRVGIGTSDPRSMLDVEDGAQFVERSATGSNDPRIKLEKVDTGSNITGKITTDNLVTTGAVGIGTASPASTGTGYGSLDIAGSDGGELYLSDGGTAKGRLFNYASDSDLIGLSAKATAGQLVFSTGGDGASNERLRIDSSGRVLVGTSAARTNVPGADEGFLVEGSTDNSSQNRFIQHIFGSNGVDGPYLGLGKHRGTSNGQSTIVSPGDEIGGIYFQGSDGTNFKQGAAILAQVDGTPGTNDMPGRLTFHTTADGASSPTERMRIDSSGNVGVGGNLIINEDSKLYLEGDTDDDYNAIWKADTENTVFLTARSHIANIIDSNNDDSEAFWSVRHNGTTLAGSTELMRVNSSGNISLGSTATSGTGVHLYPFGNVVSRRASGSLQVFEGYQGSTLTSQINAAGAATFGSGYKVGIRPFDGDSADQLYIDKTDGTRTFSVLGNGSATFAGTLTVDENINGLKAISGSGTGSTAVIRVYSDTLSTYTTDLNADGSATFTGEVSGLYFTTDRTSGANTVLQAYLNGVETSKIIASGAATFAGGITTADNIAVSRTLGTSACYVGQLNGSDTSSINADGSAVFAGTVSAQGSVLTSDQRFKENITDAKSQLADVTALGNKLRNWDWTADAPVADKATRFLGLVAQEAETICPGIVTTIARTKDGAELTPEVVVPAVYKTKTVPAVLDKEGKVVEAETTEQVLVTAEQVTPATYEKLDDSYKGIKNDILIMKLLGAVAELSAEVAALKAG